MEPKIKSKNVTKPQSGHFAKTDAPPVKVIKEVPVVAAEEGGTETKAGDRVLVDIFADAKVVDVIGPSKGHGFAWRGAPSWLCGWTQVARPYVPGAGFDRRFELSVARLSPRQRMPGRMGTDIQITVRNLRIRGIDIEENLSG